MQTGHINLANAKEAQGLKRHRFWRFLKWALLCLLFGIIIAFVYFWMHRFEFLETQVRNILKEKGFETTFNIESLSKNRTVLRKVTMATRESSPSSKKPFLTAEKIILNYEWRDAVKGNIDKLTIEGPHFFAEVDAAGKLVRPIFPKSNTNNAPLILPKDGIFIKNALGTLKNSVGVLEVSGDGTLMSRHAWDLKAKILSGELSVGPIGLKPTGDVSIEFNDGVISLRPDLALARVKTPSLNLSDGAISGSLKITPSGNDVTVQSDVRVKFKDLNLSDYGLESGTVKWLGPVKATRPNVDTSYKMTGFNGTWDVEVGTLAVKNAVRRKDLADMISLQTTLAKTPMVRNFADRPQSAFARLLTSSRVSGSGDIVYDREGYQIGLRAPVIVKGKNDKLTLRPVPTIKHALIFDKPSSELKVNLGASLDGPSALSLSNMQVSASSPDGLRLEGVNAVSAKFTLPSQWRGTTHAGQAARLGAFSSTLQYTSKDALRVFTLQGPIDYDGDVPGGYALGVRANGTTKVTVKPDRTETAFTPKENQRLSIARFENKTDWRGEAIDLSLTQDGALFVLRGEIGRLSAGITDVKAKLIDKDDTRHLNIDLARVDIKGTLSDDLQNWRMDTTDAQIISPDLPSGGSKTFAPNADMVFRLRPDQSPEFIINTTETNVTTNTVSATNMTLAIKGTPEAFDINYDDGRAKFSTEDLPDLPFSGQVRYLASQDPLRPAASVWTGTAQTALPKAEATPIDVKYTFSEGRGTADVLINELIFKPGTLQPQTYVKALKGKISQVDGTVSAALKIEFAPNEPLKSSGSASLKNMGMGTLTGPFTGINADLTFSSMFPLQSIGRQKMTASLFDPGFPLENGAFEFEIIPDGVRLYSAVWPVGQGTISIDSTDWIYTAPQNNVTMRLSNISLQDFTESFGHKNFQATGTLEGVLPVIIEGVKTEVVGGVMRVKDGGRIKFETPQTDAAGSKNEIAATAFDALKDFEYKKLEAYLDGPLDGNMIVKMGFDGKNKDILGGAVFAWDVTVEGELVNIARSFSPENLSATYKDLALESLKARQNN